MFVKKWGTLPRYIHVNCRIIMFQAPYNLPVKYDWRFRCHSRSNLQIIRVKIFSFTWSVTSTRRHTTVSSRCREIESQYYEGVIETRDEWVLLPQGFKALKVEPLSLMSKRVSQKPWKLLQYLKSSSSKLNQLFNDFFVQKIFQRLKKKSVIIRVLSFENFFACYHFYKVFREHQMKHWHLHSLSFSFQIWYNLNIRRLKKAFYPRGF